MQKIKKIAKTICKNCERRKKQQREATQRFRNKERKKCSKKIIK